MKSSTNRIIAELTAFVRAHHGWLAAGMLVAMALLAGGSMIGNSAIVDEVAHIPAGYSYLQYSDYRLNPEHPPLIKDLAGIPLQFLDLKFPTELTAWKTEINGQWETGWNFLYHIGNDADQILFWARLPILLLALAFGGVLYWLIRRRWGTGAGLITLFFYTFSPNFLAHSTLVTTDLGASISMFLVIVSFVYFAEKPGGRSFLWLSAALAFAQLVKFSSILLFPFLGAVAIGLVILQKRPKGVWDRIKIYIGGLIAATALSVAWVWTFYITQVMRMPEAVQDELIRGSLPGKMQAASDLLVSINHLPLVSGLVQYILGFYMVFNRVSSGNVTYFNGEVTNQSFHWYFPELFVLKTQIALLLLVLVLVGLAIWKIRWGSLAKWPRVLAEHLRSHLLEWSLGLYAVFYFAISVAGNLNLGVRHILPVYLPLFVIVAVASVKWVRRIKGRNAHRAMVGLALLLGWYGFSAVGTFPNYLSYFNEAIGGQGNSGKYFSDSSVDWGQDLKRLVTYVKKHPEIKHIAVDYFGGGVPEYYFCDRRYAPDGSLVAQSNGYDCSRSVYEPWHSTYGRYSGQYIAISETFLQSDRWYAKLNNHDGYEYLRQQEPIAKIGNSIYVYKLY